MSVDVLVTTRTERHEQIAGIVVTMCSITFRGNSVESDVYDIGGRSLMCKNSWKFQEYRYWKKVKYATSETLVGDAVRRVFFGVNVIETLLLYVLSVARIAGVTEKKEKKETQRSSEVTEPLDDMRHANSFRRAENFGPRIQAARSRRPNANSSVKQWWYAGRGTRERRFYSRRLFLAGCMTFDWRREQSIIHRTRRSSRVHANANLGF